MRLSRRFLLGGVSAFAISQFLARAVFAREYRGGVPWRPEAASPPDAFDPASRFLTAGERRFVSAAVDRLIPADEFPGAVELGVVDFIDSQLAGSYGRGEIFYMQAPFASGTKSQGYQTGEPAWLYRQGIAAVEKHVAGRFAGRSFAELSQQDQDALLKALEDGSLELPGVNGATFFDTLLQNTKEGYFGDPVYGGNRDMAAWRMIGFPGARYDYRPFVSRHNELFALEPVSIAGFGWNSSAGKGD